MFQYVSQYAADIGYDSDDDKDDKIKTKCITSSQQQAINHIPAASVRIFVRTV